MSISLTFVAFSFDWMNWYYKFMQNISQTTDWGDIYVNIYLLM